MIHEGEGSPTRAKARLALIIILVVSSGLALVLSLFVLFSDALRDRPVSIAQNHGMLTSYMYKNINAVHPQKAPDVLWEVENVTFENESLAIVEATNGRRTTKLEVIYLVDASSVTLVRINDISGRDQQDAHLALIRFLGLLHDGKYTEAAIFYGGAISRLLPYGTSSTPDPAKLLEGYCTRTAPGGECPLYRITNPRLDSATGAYVFVVNFLLPDGETYSLTSGKSDFNAIVEDQDGEYKVITLPFD